MTHPRRPDPPLAKDFSVGDRVQATSEIDPKVPVGTYGEVLVVLTEINEIHIQWNIPEWPYVKVTKGSPSNGYRKLRKGER